MFWCRLFHITDEENTHTHTCTHIYIHTYAHTHKDTHIHTHVHIDTHTYSHTKTSTDTHMHVQMNVCHWDHAGWICPTQTLKHRPVLPIAHGRHLCLYLKKLKPGISRNMVTCQDCSYWEMAPEKLPGLSLYPSGIHVVRLTRQALWLAEPSPDL